MSIDTKKPDDITHRLRCKYPIGPIGADGEPEFGWRDFSGPQWMTLPTPLMCEAADHIDAQAAEIAALRESLRWTAAVLQDAAGSPYCVDESGVFVIEGESRTMAQILDAADAALAQDQGEKHGTQPMHSA